MTAAMSDTLQKAIEDYHDLIRSDPAAEEQLEMLRRLQFERKVLFGDRATAHSLRPTFLTEAMYVDVQDTVYLIRQAILRLAAALFDDEGVLRRELGLREWEIELATIPTRVIRLSAMARMDAFMTADSFKFVEVNGESPAGIAYLHELGRIYRELPIFQQFTRRHPIRFVSPLRHAAAAMLHAYHEEFDGIEELPTFAIVDHLDVPTIHEFRLVKAYLERMGFPCEIADPRELECRDGWIYAGGRRVDILYRRLLMNEFHEMRASCGAFEEGYRAGKTCYLNSFRSKLVHKKAIFAMLTDERYHSLITHQQIEAIEDHIPWTRLLREQRTTFRGLTIDLLEFVRANRKYFVVKPNDEYGGKGVTLGKSATQSDWESAIELGLEAGFVVQEIVHIHREPFLMHADGEWNLVPTVIDLDPYLNGPLMGGCLTRTSATDLANVTAGGGTLPLFILRDEAHVIMRDEAHA